MLTPQLARGVTLFSQERFLQAIGRAHMLEGRVLKLQSASSPACLFAFERRCKLRTRSILLGPFGLYAYPCLHQGLDDCVSEFVAQLWSFSTISFQWNVRFDHRDLADSLAGCGLNRIGDTTHVLYLHRPYNELFRHFGAAARNKIRRAERKGVLVRRTTNPSGVAVFYKLYEKLIAERNSWSTIYSQSIFDELILLLTMLFS